jgi:hypothetical protein
MSDPRCLCAMLIILIHIVPLSMGYSSDSDQIYDQAHYVGGSLFGIWIKFKVGIVRDVITSNEQCYWYRNGR